MADRAMVKGMILTKREVRPCDACHVGKQRQKRRLKSIDRGLTAPNQIVYADLMFPSKDINSKYKVVLVIMDGWSQFLTVYLLKNKSASTVNEKMRQCILWAERQAGRRVTKIIERKYEPTEATRFPVQCVLTDKGREFVNNDIDHWYAEKGIEHLKVGPKGSHLNPVERAIQSLVDATKASIHESPIDGIPYTLYFWVDADIHHIRPVGSLAYIHVPKTPERKKEDDNARIGFIVGYAEDTVGVQVY
ncbi:hypothetical protein PsorP6_000451 [Peronosclerospora sorghi]|uniref:Uncharacterized protein n=1 Tax=Peronosclerospora sorghi TaxID=230839 RepID=A0ACC0WYF0_9STRA|nr:hypothetical protein PsorP6_000451 [Peronosclerospora sorghi]